MSILPKFLYNFFLYFYTIFIFIDINQIVIIMSTYSINQFSEITGITKFVLRTWENRYGFLKPERSETNIRIYTDEMLVRANFEY